MSYKHLLVAIDLSEESQLLINKAVKLAKVTDAKVSLIHVDVIQGDEFTRKIVNSLVVENGVKSETVNSKLQLAKLKENSDYPIEHTLVGYGGFIDELEEAIEEYQFDLIVCGHHQDFWHNLSSAAKQMIGTLPVDMLVIPLK